MLVVGHGFDSLDSPRQGPVIRTDGLPRLPSMDHGQVFGGFSASTFPWGKKGMYTLTCIFGVDANRSYYPHMD
jgi:hypothetical protein